MRRNLNGTRPMVPSPVGYWVGLQHGEKASGAMIAFSVRSFRTHSGSDSEEAAVAASASIHFTEHSATEEKT